MRIVRVVIPLIAFVAMLLVASASYAAVPRGRSFACDSLRHRVSVELRPAYNIVSHYAMRDGERPLNSAMSFHLRYAFSFSPDSQIGRLYPTAYQGVGIATYTFWSHPTTGTPTTAYIMQGGRIADLGDNLSLGYEWNLGVSWGWHPNEAMNSRCNVMINVALPLSWRVAPHWELQLTPDFTHFSDGDTHFSNSGANLFGVRLGVAYLFDTERVKADAARYIMPSEELARGTFADHMSYDVMLYGGWRADRFTDAAGFHVVDEAMPVAGVNFQPHYHLNRYFAVGVSLDVQYDSSLNLRDAVVDIEGEVIDYSRPPLWQQMEVGLSLRAEIEAPIFSVGAGVGVNMLSTGYDSSLMYATFSLKAFLTRRLFLYVGYRFNSTQYTQNMMYGVGMRF